MVPNFCGPKNDKEKTTNKFEVSGSNIKGLKKDMRKNSMVEKIQLGVSKNKGTPKWMVSNGKPY